VAVTVPDCQSAGSGTALCRRTESPESERAPARRGPSNRPRRGRGREKAGMRWYLGYGRGILFYSRQVPRPIEGRTVNSRPARREAPAGAEKSWNADSASYFHRLTMIRAEATAATAATSSWASVRSDCMRLACRASACKALMNSVFFLLCFAAVEQRSLLSDCCDCIALSVRRGRSRIAQQYFPATRCVTNRRSGCYTFRTRRCVPGGTE